MSFTTQKQKKKPPPRPPPPNFSKLRSKSTLNLVQASNSANLIQWSPPSSPKPDRTIHFGGSVSSSFSSSTSSLASSKKSFEFDSPVGNNVWPVQAQNTIHPPQSNAGATFQSYVVTGSADASAKIGTSNNLNVPSIFGPTIIRAKVKPNTRTDNICPKSDSPPMPNIPPPSPPKVNIDEVETPYGIALYDYPASHSSDLNLEAGDIVILIRRINDDWLYGKVIDREGMFPESFIEIQVPLKEDANLVTALYDFQAQMLEDLNLKAGQKIKVLRKISDEWLYGEYSGQRGQFPSNFVDRVPTNI